MALFVSILSQKFFLLSSLYFYIYLFFLFLTPKEQQLKKGLRNIASPFRLLILKKKKNPNNLIAIKMFG